MSIYKLFELSPTSPLTQTQFRKRFDALTPERVRADFARRGWGEPPAALIDAMRAHVLASAKVISDPVSRDIYNAWEQHESGVVDRMTWYNRRVCPLFSDACFENRTSQEVHTAPHTPVRTETRCRWCAGPFQMNESALYQCKCGGWAGHRGCGQAFATEYKQRCPVCRTALLPRDQPSKYMFFSAEQKYKF